MKDFVAALGLLLVIEGVVHALFPAAIRRMGEMLRDLPDGILRQSGLAAAIVGVALVWLVRH